MSWPEERPFDARELDLIDALAAQCAQALQRVLAAQARQEQAREVQQLAQSLQQALLTPPPQPDHLHIAVRYRPASHAAQIGGDWYDAFLQPDGATMLVIGDVIGHDSAAAAKMGQLRGLLRALAYAADDSHAGDTPATALTGPSAPPAVSTSRHSRPSSWSGSNASPTSRSPADGSCAGATPDTSPRCCCILTGPSELLDRPADLLLGVDPHSRRHDHTHDLPDGATLLLFTDGLVERRGENLDDGLTRLRNALTDLAQVPLDELCDAVLERLARRRGRRHRAAGPPRAPRGPAPDRCTQGPSICHPAQPEQAPSQRDQWIDRCCKPRRRRRSAAPQPPSEIRRGHSARARASWPPTGHAASWTASGRGLTASRVLLAR